MLNRMQKVWNKMWSPFFKSRCYPPKEIQEQFYSWENNQLCYQKTNTDLWIYIQNEKAAFQLLFGCCIN